MPVATDQTLSGWLAQLSREQAEAAAIHDSHGTMSYAELSRAVASLCSGFARAGIGPGDVIAIQLPNIREFVIAFLAAAARGATVQTLHMPYRSKELSGLLADSGARAVIVTHSDTDSRALDVLGIRSGLPNLNELIVLGDAPAGCISLSDLAGTAAKAADQVVSTPDDRYLLLYTSGTTAEPKGVPHSYRGFLNNALKAADEMGIGAGNTILSLAPMTHLYGLFTMNLALAAGAAMHMIPAFNPQRLTDDLKASAATHVFAAPAHFAVGFSSGILNAEHFAETRLLCLSGAAVPVDLASGLDALMPRGKVIQLWGMSELQAGTFGRPGDPPEKRFATAGRAAPGAEIRVVNEDGSELAPGTEGALQMRGEALFAAYLNKPQETEIAFDNRGWFGTGDLAKFDDQGFLTITGRTKEIINRGGVKYNPIEVEDILQRHPAIAQCAIVPLPDPGLGERGCLCIQPSGDADITLAEMCEMLGAAGIAKYKWPERMVTLAEFPMTPTRKIKRGELIEIAKKRTNT